MEPLATTAAGTAGGGAAVRGPVTTSSGGTSAQPDRTTSAHKARRLIRAWNIVTISLDLQLCQASQHLVSRGNGLTVNFVGALGADHIDPLFRHIDVGGFVVLVHHQTWTVHTGLQKVGGTRG